MPTQTLQYRMAPRVDAVRVSSQSAVGKEYTVKMMTCDCPDYALSNRGKDACKHIEATMAWLLGKLGYAVIPPVE